MSSDSNILVTEVPDQEAAEIREENSLKVSINSSESDGE